MTGFALRPPRSPSTPGVGAAVTVTGPRSTYPKMQNTQENSHEMALRCGRYLPNNIQT